MNVSTRVELLNKYSLNQELSKFISWNFSNISFNNTSYKIDNNKLNEIFNQTSNITQIVNQPTIYFNSNSMNLNDIVSTFKNFSIHGMSKFI